MIYGGTKMKLYSNEIVFRGHPDKVCDQISDAILDACLSQDKYSRCGVEVVGGKGKIFITGEVTTNAIIDVEAIAKRVLTDIGYSANYEVINNLGKQSNDIAQGVDVGGAGDNGMMFGYACNDTEQSLPTAMVILQKLSRKYDELRKIDNRFKPDGKCQITGLYDNNFKLVEIKTFTICYQNTELDRNKTDNILIKIVEDIISKYNIKVKQYLINPTGKFEIGGFEGDAGLTGRKIVVDSYQSFANVGGGAFSGKDPSKVDRSGAYKAREIAKETLKAKNLKWCEVQISYAIGIDHPLAIYIDSDKGTIEPTELLYEQCKPANIIKDLKLREIKYEELARFGHFN
jgi:S-adenosylmethionine synthetase